jgi:biotin carboxylase
MAKTLLIVCGGIEALHGIQLAKARGLHVVVSDMNADAPGMTIADDKIVASTYDVRETLAAAVRYHQNVRPIDGVMCLGADVPSTVAAVAHELRLPGITRDSARLATDKLAMKMRFRRDSVPIPWFAPVNSINDLESHFKKRKEILVIKPADSRGSRGVQRIDTKTDLAHAFAMALAESPSRRVMVEAYLPGPQISTESIILEGKAYTPGISDRNYEYLERFAPYFIENGGDLPSKLPSDQIEAVKSVVEAAAKSLGIVNGNVKGDMVVHEDQAYVIELAARLSGGYFCTLEIPLNTGVDFVGAVISMALGEPVRPQDLRPKRQTPVVQRYKFLPSGRITGIHGLEAAQSIEGVEEVMISASVGDLINAPTNSTARAAMAIATGATLEAAKRSVNAAVDALVFEMDQTHPNMAEETTPDTYREARA